MGTKGGKGGGSGFKISGVSKEMLDELGQFEGSRKTWAKTLINSTLSSPGAFTGVAVRDKKGSVVGLMQLSVGKSVLDKANVIEIESLVSASKVKGAGKVLVGRAVEMARSKGVGVQLTATSASRGFYEKSGLKKKNKTVFGLSASEVKRFGV